MRSLKTEQQANGGGKDLVSPRNAVNASRFVPFRLLRRLLADPFGKYLLFRFPYASFLHRKEVIQPHLPIRLPCYDLTPIIESTFGSCLLAVSSLTSGVPNFHGLTGGVYKARERIHRGMLIRDY